MTWKSSLKRSPVEAELDQIVDLLFGLRQEIANVCIDHGLPKRATMDLEKIGEQIGDLGSRVAKLQSGFGVL